MQWTTVRASAAIVSFLCLANFAQAGFISGDIIRLGDAPGGPGGLFDVKKPGNPAVLFQTFCAHVYEDLDYETNYKAVISDVTDPDGRPVGPQAAWLYTQFLRQDTDQLPGFKFDRITPAWNSTNSANKQARALQLGIWLGMGFTTSQIKYNTGWSTSTVSDLRNSYLNKWLDNYELSGWRQNNFTGRIKILNLYGYSSRTGDYTRNMQDQLIEVPEPSAAVLLGALLFGAAWGRIARHSPGDAAC